MKNILSYLFIFIAFTSLAQKKEFFGKIEYLTVLTFGSASKANSTLVFSPKKSCFIEGKFYLSHSFKESNKVIQHGDSLDHSDTKFYTDLLDKKIYKHHIIDKKHYLAKENIVSIKWNILNEFKIILKHNCQKAIGKFRGRVYTVWFTQGIPVRLGPWKLNGLPGLILEAHDHYNQVDFFAMKLEFLDEKTFNKTLLTPNFDESIEISLKENLKIEAKRNVAILNKIIASMPRGTVITGVKMNEDRKMNKEITYEWEELDEKK